MASPDRLTWRESTSSNVARYAHDLDANRLYVQFRNGTAGYYDNVPDDIFQQFHGAASHGKFLHGRLKASQRHPWTKDDTMATCAKCGGAHATKNCKK